MGLYSDALDDLVVKAQAVLGVPATRDPSQVAYLTASGGCILVGFPVQAGRLLEGGGNLDVPVSLVAPAPGDLDAVDWLLEHLEGLVEFTQVATTTHGPLDIGEQTYPAVTATARIAVQED